MWVLGFVSMKLSGICLPHLEVAAFMLAHSYWKSPKRRLFLCVIKTITVSLLIPEHSNKLTAKIERHQQDKHGSREGLCLPRESLPQRAAIAQLTFPFRPGSNAPSAESQELFIDYYTPSLTSTC